ncbi:MAG: hypothetical protein ACYDEV_05065 [Acidiferrobacter sp.]
MKGKYVTAVSTLGVVSVIALTLSLLPAHKAVTPQAVATQSTAPFRQIRVYRTPGGGLLRTETLRWQGPGSMTIVTWSSNGKPNAAIPPWVGVELQNMQAQQRFLATAMQQMIGRGRLGLPQAAPWGLMAPFGIPVELPKVAAPHKAAPLRALMQHVPRTVDL